MAARIFSTILLWAVAIAAVVFARAFGLAVLVWALAAGALAEALAACRKMGFSPMSGICQAACAAIILGGWCAAEKYGEIGMSIPLIVCAAVPVLLLKDPFGNFWSKSLLPSLLAILAIPFALQWLVFMPQKFGLMFPIMVLAAAKFSDVGAFVIGKGFGRRKLAPETSPNKTWEGAIGGIFAAAAVAAAFAWGFHGTQLMPKNFLPTDAIVFGAAIGACAIASDLLESAFKRRARVKDSGKIIPGIGGILDLADSLLLSAPAAVAMAAVMNLG